MIIYMIKNTVNGKIYIGQTVQFLNQRWSKHINAKKNTYLAFALDKYGRDKFTIEQIDTAQTLDELNQKEQYWISFYNSTDREIGYNIKAGGENHLLAEETKIKIGLANSGKKASVETRKKQSEARKGKKLSKETCQKMSESKKGHIVSEETRSKIGQKHKNKIVSEESKLKMSEARKGKRYLSDERYKELGEKQKGKKRPELSDKMKGLKYSQERVEKSRLARIGKKRTPEQKERMRQGHILAKLKKDSIV